MKKILLAFAFCFAALSAFSSYAAEPRQAPTEQERARTVYIFHQPIVMLQAKFGLTTPEERVLRIRNTLRNFTEADVREPLVCWRCCCSATARGDPGAGFDASTVCVLWRIAAGCRKAGGGTLAPLRFGFTPC